VETGEDGVIVCRVLGHAEAGQERGHEEGKWDHC
jgi:hypothetical protein